MRRRKRVATWAPAHAEADGVDGADRVDLSPLAMLSTLIQCTCVCTDVFFQHALQCDRALRACQQAPTSNLEVTIHISSKQTCFKDLAIQAVAAIFVATTVCCVNNVVET